MADGDVEQRPGPLAFAGCGCGCLGGLLALGGVMLLIAIFLGAFNSSVEGQATAGASSSICVGIVVGIVGMVLYFVGNRPRD